MSQFVETGVRAFVAAAARAQFLRVYLSGTTLTTAGASNAMIGTQEVASLATTDVVPVRLRNAAGTRKMVASGAITAGADVYAAASGKIASSGTIIEGQALEAATADGDIIEVLEATSTTVASAATGTTAATYTVDSDAATPKIKLSGQAAGTGDFTTTLKPEATLSADNAIIVPEADGDTLVAVALAQTLTNKTLTAPVIGGGLTASGSAANTFAGSTGTFVTSTGLNTLSGFAALKGITAAVAAAGSTVADAGQLGAANIVHLTSDSANKGVKLGTGVAGQTVFVINDSATAAKLYAASGGTLNGLSADAAVVIAASKGVLCFCTAADTWIVFDLPAKATTA